MAFNWQPLGALGGMVPNQLGSSTPKNNEGLAMPWGQAMFNLPRYQMPGSQVNFGGGFNLSGDMQGAPGQSQMGMQPGANIGNVRFSLNRQASSDPVQNIINDVQNPLSGMSLNFTNGAASPVAAEKPKPQGPGLREMMMGFDGHTANMPFWGATDNPYGQAMALQKQFGMASTNQGQPSSYENDGTYGSIASGLRRKMIGPLVFM